MLTPEGPEDTPAASDLKRVQELFESALDWPIEERYSRLSLAVADPELESEVRALLRAHESEGPLDAVTAALARTGPAVESSARSGSIPTRIGRYRIEGEIGSGGMSRVYRARSIGSESSPVVALKVLRADADSERVRRRFLAERQILAGLEHDRIARLLDDGLTEEGAPYLVTEYIEGEAIDRFCDHREVPLKQRAGFVRDVCAAVEYAHSRGVIHRDLKPENIQVTPRGSVHLLDFGIAKVLDDLAFPGLGRPTTTGVHIMTLSYASPEQLRGERITTASDVYQLGLVLVKLLTGRVPPVYDRLSASPPNEPLWKPELGGSGEERAVLSALHDVVRRALSTSTDDRQSSVRAMADEIERAISRRERTGLRALFGRPRQE